ncbi:hypothetical protein FRC08_009522 [Ceratobasidium sp. 394]|nr:hypothetical protein FRC08_009522 [Ceratobasidium sp. 394]KAG9085618.1 hypothetical protein FS749_004284 [Ceratobasidium sp. UAMH 11750]
MSNNIVNPDTLDLPYYVAAYKGRSVAIKRDTDYQATIKIIQKSIPKLRSADAEDIFMATTLAGFGDTLVQISEEIWPDVVARLKTVEVTLEDATDAIHPPSQNTIFARQDEHIATAATAANLAPEPPEPQAAGHPATDPSDTLMVSVRTTSQALLEFSYIRPSSTIGELKSLIETAYRVPAVLQRLNLLGQPLDNTKTLEQCKITNWTILDLHLNARQYMIYLYNDQTLQTSERFRHKDVEVRLSLNRAWELSTLRPSIQTPAQDYPQSVSWTVDVGWGALFDHGSNTETTCLFWDGISQAVQSAALTSRRLQSQLIDPYPPHGSPNLIPLLDPKNSAAIPFDEVEGYIKSIFYDLGFTVYSLSPAHFIYQLKQKTHDYIALRFISQADCEPMASLCISPPTNHITQILVLFKGLSAAAAEIWDIPLPRYPQRPDPWKDAGTGVVLSNNFWCLHPGLKVVEISWMEVF